MRAEGRGDIGGAVIAVLMIAFGVLAVHDTTTYADADSAVFPRTVAMGLIAFCAVYLLMWAIGRAQGAEPHQPGSWPRRIAFVATMLAAALAMPWVGFIASAMVAFAALMVVAKFDRWTPARTLLYGAIGVAVILGFYTLFAKFLLVPLPTGWLFKG